MRICRAAASGAPGSVSQSTGGGDPRCPQTEKALQAGSGGSQGLEIRSRENRCGPRPPHIPDRSQGDVSHNRCKARAIWIRFGVITRVFYEKANQTVKGSVGGIVSSDAFGRTGRIAPRSASWGRQKVAQPPAGVNVRTALSGRFLPPRAVFPLTMPALLVTFRPVSQGAFAWASLGRRRSFLWLNVATKKCCWLARRSRHTSSQRDSCALPTSWQR